MGSKKDDNYWRTSIADAELNEETWKVKVMIIEPAGSDDDRTYMNKFETCAALARRFVIKNICKTETLFMTNQLGGENKGKESLRVFEEGQAYLKAKKEIPADILALIIKHLILKMKDEYLFIKRQRLVLKKGINNESVTMINKAEVRGTVKVSLSSSSISMNTPKTKKKSGDDEHGKPDPEKKYNTLLRVRGEEWRDKVYIDDFPVDGPNLYVAITGFTEPYLAGCLVKIGIPLIAIVKLRIEPSIKIQSSLSRPIKRGQSQSDILGVKYLKFWDDLQLLRIKNDCDSLKNTAFIVFSPPFCKEEGLSGDQEKIYDELSYLMYDLQDLTRQHAHYLDNLHVISIPEEAPNVILHANYSTNTILPLESTTLYSILDNIIQTVSKNIDLGDINTSSPSVVLHSPLEDTLEKNKPSKIETFVKEVFSNLCNTNINKNKYRATLSNEAIYDPIIINYGDLSKYSTFHLKDLNLHDIIRSTLYGMPVNKLWQYFDRLSGKREAKVNFHLNILLSCFNRKNVEISELNRLIHILSCRKLYNNRSCLKKQHLQQSTIDNLKKRLLKRSLLAEPLKSIISANKMAKSSGIGNCSSSSLNFNQSPYNKSNESLRNEEADHASSIKLLFECPDISELISVTEIVGKYPFNQDIIENFDYFEEFRDAVALQVLHNAFNSFNCVDYKHCEATDSLILMFFNSYGNDSISREEWRGHITTPICLQDFFDFVLDEHYDWVQNEENTYFQSIHSATSYVSKDLKNSLIAEGCVGSKKVESELLIEGSLKHRDHVEREVVTDATLKPKVFKKTNSPSNISKNNMKTKSSRPSTGISLKQSLTLSDSENTMSLEVSSKKVFNGYNLCDRRVEAFGKNSTYFSKDGTKISSKYTSLLHTDVDYLSLNVVSGNGSNEFWMHRIVSENVESDLLDTCESFRICTQNNISICVKKQLFTIPVAVETSSTKVGTEKSPQNLSNKTIELSEISFHSLSLTWPNGLITETVYDNNSNVISHIKQFYVSGLNFENGSMRCVSMNGEVIIFKKDGSTEVMRPAGAYINITKCVKVKKGEPIQEDIFSEVSLGPKKKRKTNDNKDKASTKSSNSDKSKNIDYELIVEEYEITNTNSLRQKWVHNNFFNEEKLLTRIATDYCLGEIFTKRSDGTNIILDKDGNLVTTYPDNTRIITSFIIESDEIYPEWTEEEIIYFSLNDFIEFETDSTGTKQSVSEKNVASINGYISVYIVYTIEHPNFTTVTINKANDKVSIESPNNICVQINNDNKYEFQLDAATSAKFNGESLIICYKACSECMHSNKCTVNINPIGKHYDDVENVWLHMKDSFKNVIVDKEGEILATEDQDSDHTSCVLCTNLNVAKSMKFFILNRELSCTELVHRVLVDQHKQACRHLQWCSINEYQTFEEYRTWQSMLTPIHRTESEKWIMDCKLANQPEHLVYKHLEHDDGKGFYHWMRPYKIYEQKPITIENSVPVGLPKAYILRTLERQWDESNRINLKGANELVQALLKYREVLGSSSRDVIDVPIRDLRSENKRKSDSNIQNIAQRLYYDLKKRLSHDNESRARPIITTKSKPEKTEDFDTDEKRTIQEIYADEIKEVESAAKTNSKLDRYWRRRNEEYNKELFNKYLLREDSIPPYFRNALGGAIWWDINKTAADAVNTVETATCFCDIPGEAGEAGESSSDVFVPSTN